jgi:hypothetical protein
MQLSSPLLLKQDQALPPHPLDTKMEIVLDNAENEEENSE